MLGKMTFPALGSTAVVLTADAARLPAAVSAVMAEVDDIDRTCSRFRRDSDLEAANRAAGAWCEVHPLLIEAVETAIRAAWLTGGDVDPTVGPAMRAIGYDRDLSLIPDRGAAMADPVPAMRWREIGVDPGGSRIRVPDGASLDLGATAKALAADRAARDAHEAAGCGVLVSLGGDMAAAGEAPDDGWDVGIADAHDGKPESGEDVRIFDGGIATSSTTVRRWHRGRTLVHHVVDPRTGLPAPEVWRTVSVIAATCVEANIASTASIVRGEAALRWLEGLGLPARLVRADGDVVVTPAWPVRVAA